MGLLKAGVGALSGVLADQWREFFYCESLSSDVLAAKGQKRVSGRSSNTKGDPNIISNGSIVSVNEGQCMIIVESGKVVEVCAEPGEFLYDSSSEPSVFYGSLGEGILKSFAEVGKRFAFGGDTGKDQRVYYFNTKEIIGNKYGTASPVPFRVVDRAIGLDVDIAVRCNGEYSYKLTDPLLFYKNVCGNVESAYTRDMIDSQLKSELLTALQPAFAKISAMGIRYSAIPGHTIEVAEALNEVLSAKWSEQRGISVASFGVNSISASEEDEQLIKELQKTAVLRNPTMAAASIASAQSDAMRAAATNEGGSMLGFMGLGMANAVGGLDAGSLFAMEQQRTADRATEAPSAQQSSAHGWTCTCGTRNAGNFCQNCGMPKPTSQTVSEDWTCSCGTRNAGNFCQNCGRPRSTPSDWTCSCGTVNAGNFCQNCGARRP